MIAERALIVGFGITGEAMARALTARGADVLVVDDHPSPERRRRAELAGVELLEAPDREQWRTLVEGRSAVLPTPGLPEVHPVFAEAARASVPVLSEFDLAAAWDDRPVLAITGTNGKTTVTMMVTDMMNASGRSAVAVGNTETPLVAAIDDPTVDVFVVEASSFRLAATQRFVPTAATWLNFAADHLDVHASLERYEHAKARIWSDLDADHGTAIANADDEVVMRHRNPQARTRTFGLGDRASVDYGVRGEQLLAPDDEPLVRTGELFRSLPHDISNALAASATARAGGATFDGVREVLRTFAGLPHRVELVGERDGVRWYDDSKATAPHATVAAVTGFASVVLIAGGRNKGLDLSPLGELAPHVRAVVAIGEAADDVVAAFAGRRPTVVATTMADAVARAAALAEPGDAVVLSPGCASFDWFTSYGHRGDVYTAEVRNLLGGAGS